MGWIPCELVGATFFGPHLSDYYRGYQTIADVLTNTAQPIGNESLEYAGQTQMNKDPERVHLYTAN